MDFRDFGKAVERTARAVAPAYKAGAVGIVSVAAPWAAPFVAITPPRVLMAMQIPLLPLLLIPEYREGVQDDAGKIDYAKIGELAAIAYLKGR